MFAATMLQPLLVYPLQDHTIGIVEAVPDLKLQLRAASAFWRVVYLKQQLSLGTEHR